jgi:hypothetical protein
VSNDLYHTHPILHAGFNSDDIDGDEWNGPGTNWPVQPVLFDTFVGLKPLFITEDMLAAFAECPDLVIACESDTITIAAAVPALRAA